jgi:cyanate permease
MVVALCSGISALVKAITESWWYLAFVAIDFAAAALLVWSIIQLRRAFEEHRAEAIERETVVRRYVETQGERSDRHHL